MPTVQEILNDIRTRLPASTNTFTDGVIVGWINQAQNEVWRYMASTELYEFDTIASQAFYNMASDMRIDMIKSVQVSNSTVIDGTETYSDYTYAGPNEQMSGNNYYNALGQLGLYPVPTSDGAGYNVKITYEKSPTQLSTNTLTTVPDINTEYQDILKFRAIKIMAQSGNAPDVELANNYQREEDSIFKRVKMDFYRRKAKNPKTRFNYKENWWNG